MCNYFKDFFNQKNFNDSTGGWLGSLSLSTTVLQAAKPKIEWDELYISSLDDGLPYTVVAGERTGFKVWLHPSEKENLPTVNTT